MIVWGSGGDEAFLGSLGESHCESCDKMTAFNGVVTYKFWHIWYIISWLVDRDYFAVCSNCGARYAIKKKEARKLFPKDNIPVVRKYGWTLALLGVLLLTGNMIITKQNESDYLQAPLAGDIYLTNLAKVSESGFTGERAYGMLRVIAVEGDMLILATSKEGYSAKSGVDQLIKARDNSATYDLEEFLTIPLSTIEKFYRQKVIYEIIR